MSIFYKSTRVGQYGKTFKLCKLRTMVEGADKKGGSSTANNDCRITRVGHFLRKYKLDELPSLYNLLKGDIGLVGWRPETPDYLNTFPKEILDTKPGMTGLGTLYDYNEGEVLVGVDNPDKYYREKILPKKRELELYYIRNKSLWLDIKILVKTAWKIVA